MARQKDGKLDMALPEPTPIYANGEERARKARIADALATGNRLSSDDMREGEYFAMTHRAMLAVLATARLTPNEFQYLFALLAHTNGKQPWAIAEYPDKLPRLNDWAAWLGGMTTQQVYNIRASLHERGIIAYVDDNPAKVALVQAWESWDQSTFAPHTPRKGAGRKPKSKLGNLDSDVNQGMYITEFTPDKSPNLEVVIRQFSADASEGAISQASDTPLNKGKKEENKRDDAHASSDANAPTPRKRSSSRPRKLTDEQYAAKMREEEWKAALFAGMEAINGYPITGKGKERAAAHELYGYRGPKNRDSVLSVETILDCYRLTLIDPFYGQDQLSLQTILKKIGAYLNSPENFRRGMEEKRRKAEYVSNGANGHKQPKQSRADAQAAAFTRSYEDVLPK